MLEVDEAQSQLLQSIIPIERATESLPLADALDRICASEVNAIADSPPFRRSVMDGYAVRAEDLPGPLPVAFELPAGSPVRVLPPGQCARIFTGAPVPDGADRVVPQENKIGELNGVILEPSGQPWIRPVGDDVQIGQTLVKKGQTLGPVELGLLASGGHAQVEVLRRLKVALITTGDELRPPGEPLAPGQIHNANGLMLAGLLNKWGVECAVHHVADDREGIQATLYEANQVSDLVITVGGVSVGEHDHIRPSIEALGRIEAYRVRMKPGKPFAWGQIGVTPVLCLPGNPASAMAGALLFAKPVIQALRYQPTESFSFAVPSCFEVPAEGRRRFLRVRLTERGLVLHPNQDSGALSPMSWASGLAEVEPEQSVSRGQNLTYHPFESLI